VGERPGEGSHVLDVDMRLLASDRDRGEQEGKGRAWEGSLKAPTRCSAEFVRSSVAFLASCTQNNITNPNGITSQTAQDNKQRGFAYCSPITATW
jgi:hypothetical protein